MLPLVTTRTTPPMTTRGGLDRYFKISERGSTVGSEVRGGIVTFFTMSYIIVLNPLILGFAPDQDGALLGSSTDRPNLAAIAAGTALVAGVLTILMGVVANFPLALATGLGLNAFVAFSVANQMTWADAMGLVVIEGLVILVLVLTGFREAVFHAVPAQLKIAISVGIGLFIALIGFVDAGFVRRIPDAAHSTVPVQLGQNGQLAGWPVLVFAIGLVLVVSLWVLRVRGAILISIIVTTVVAILVEVVADLGASSADNPKGWSLNVPAWPDEIIATPHFDTLGEFSLLGSWGNAGVVTAVLLIFTLMLADFFDTMGTMTAIGAEAGLLEEDGTPPNTGRILVVDSLAAAAGGAAGVSSNTSYIESASGVGEGARTGLASVVTGVLFLAAIFVAPIVEIIPSEAAVPALVLVGFLMMQQVKGIDWDDLEIAIPAFLTIVLMPFTYSISVGIGAGFLAFVLVGGGGPVGSSPAACQPKRQWARGHRRPPRPRAGGGGPTSFRDPKPESLAWVMSYANEMPTLQKVARTDAGLAAELRLSVMRLRRRLASERHPDNELSINQMGVLGVLYRTGDALSVGELAAAERVQPPSMTRTVNCLEESGDVVRRPHETDGRQVLVELSEKGRSRVLADRERRDAWLARRLKELTPEERAILRQAAPLLEHLAQRD